MGTEVLQVPYEWDERTLMWIARCPHCGQMVDFIPKESERPVSEEGVLHECQQ